MSFTVDDFQDLLRLLGQHPEWRDELRRHVLTDELLELPAIVRRLAEAQERTEQQLASLAEQVDQLAVAQARTDQQLASLGARVDQLTARIDQLAEAQTRTERRLAELAEAQARTETQLGVLTDRVGSLADRLQVLTDRVGTLDGEVLELRYARQAPAYFSRLARRLRVLEPAALVDLLDQAVEEGRLAEAARTDLMLADLVLSGRRREDGAEVYLLAEVSAGVGPDDVRRAADRATVLATLGRPVVAVVAGRWITPEAAELAGPRGVWQVTNGKASQPDEA
jgi:hypothetical protein